MARAQQVTRRGNPGEPCKECGNVVSPSYMKSHLRLKHGIRTRGRGRQKSKITHLPVPVQHSTEVVRAEAVTMTDESPVANAMAMAFTPMPFIVLEDSQGSLWIAEKVPERT